MSTTDSVVTLCVILAGGALSGILYRDLQFSTMFLKNGVREKSIQFVRFASPRLSLLTFCVMGRFWLVHIPIDEIPISLHVISLLMSLSLSAVWLLLLDIIKQFLKLSLTCCGRHEEAEGDIFKLRSLMGTCVIFIACTAVSAVYLRYWPVEVAELVFLLYLGGLIAYLAVVLKGLDKQLVSAKACLQQRDEREQPRPAAMASSASLQPESSVARSCSGDFCAKYHRQTNSPTTACSQCKRRQIASELLLLRRFRNAMVVLYAAYALSWAVNSRLLRGDVNTYIYHTSPHIYVLTILAYLVALGFSSVFSFHLHKVYFKQVNKPRQSASRPAQPLQDPGTRMNTRPDQRTWVEFSSWSFVDGNARLDGKVPDEKVPDEKVGPPVLELPPSLFSANVQNQGERIEGVFLDIRCPNNTVNSRLRKMIDYQGSTPLTVYRAHLQRLNIDNEHAHEPNLSQGSSDDNSQTQILSVEFEVGRNLKREVDARRTPPGQEVESTARTANLTPAIVHRGVGDVHSPTATTAVLTSAIVLREASGQVLV
eukprot:g6522.t1